MLSDIKETAMTVAAVAVCIGCIAGIIALAAVISSVVFAALPILLLVLGLYVIGYKVYKAIFKRERVSV